MRLRRCRRAAALAWALTVCVIKLVLLRVRGPLTPVARAVWLQRACRRILASLGIGWRVRGAVPVHGLVVSNHLSYLDILICGAAMPCAFVAKIEVSKWPYFGMAARAADTLFIDRSSRASALAVADAMYARFKLPVPVLLFPEGTSTDGLQVLRFHPTLFEPAVKAAAPVTPAAVRYVIDQGVAESELCWFGDAPFVAHLWKALGTPGFTAEVDFGEAVIYGDRREAAQATQALVCQMRATSGAPDLHAIEAQLVS